MLIKQFSIGENNNPTLTKKKNITNIIYLTNFILHQIHNINDVYIYRKSLYMHKMKEGILNQLDNV